MCIPRSLWVGAIFAVLAAVGAAAGWGWSDSSPEPESLSVVGADRADPMLDLESSGEEEPLRAPVGLSPADMDAAPSVVEDSHQGGQLSALEADLISTLDGAIGTWTNPEAQAHYLGRPNDVRSVTFREKYMPEGKELSEPALGELQLLVNDLQRQVYEARIAVQIEKFEAAKLMVARGRYEMISGMRSAPKGMAVVILPAPNGKESAEVLLSPDEHTRLFAAYEEKYRREDVMDSSIRQFIDSH